MPSWTASFTTPTAFNSPEKACESRKPAIKRLTQTQTPEPITMSVEAAAHDRAKYLLTIKRNERSPSREIAAHHQRNAQPMSANLTLNAKNSARQALLETDVSNKLARSRRWPAQSKISKTPSTELTESPERPQQRLSR